MANENTQVALSGGADPFTNVSLHVGGHSQISEQVDDEVQLRKLEIEVQGYVHRYLNNLAQRASLMHPTCLRSGKIEITPPGLGFKHGRLTENHNLDPPSGLPWGGGGDKGKVEKHT